MFRIQIIGRYVKMTQLTLDKKYVINTLYNEFGEKVNVTKFKRIYEKD
jgi:hypothetical protein|tara:strand:- start:352 stop:495 length:144 start_codon:yes stop_codon:yes gene_type:complete